MKKLYLIIMVCLISACTKNVKLIDYKESAKPMTSQNYEVISESEGLSSSFKLLFFANLSGDEADIAKAEEYAISREAADNLIGVSYYEETVYMLLGKVKAYYVKGTAVKYK